MYLICVKLAGNPGFLLCDVSQLVPHLPVANVTQFLEDSDAVKLVPDDGRFILVPEFSLTFQNTERGLAMRIDPFIFSSMDVPVHDIQVVNLTAKFVKTVLDDIRKHTTGLIV